MSLRSTGKYRCDGPGKCNREVAGGNVANGTIITDVDPNKPGEVRTRHLCDRCGPIILAPLDPEDSA